MMKYFIVVFIVMFSSVASACNDDQAGYAFKTFGGSEFEFSLQIEGDQFLITHREWQPGGYENASTESFSGLVRCYGGNIDFFIDQEEVAKAKLIEIGMNPLGLPEETKAILFENSSIYSELEGQLLYLEK
ncbi:hypothetical protein N9W78_00035 [bacterium]|nr:hypothetical protein [bacterium]